MVRQKLGVTKWKKIGVLAFQKVAKTGNIGKKSPVAGDIDYVRYLSMQKVNGLQQFGHDATKSFTKKNVALTFRHCCMMQQNL